MEDVAAREETRVTPLPLRYATCQPRKKPSSIFDGPPTDFVLNFKMELNKK